MTSSPNNLGVTDGQLAPCPSTPNCVCSQCGEDQEGHFISPMSYAISAELLIKLVIEVLRDMPRTEVIKVSDNYVRAESTTLIMRFTDDFEIYIDSKKKLLHFRSASRVGRSDFGVNRKRVESFKHKLAAKMKASVE